MKKQCMIFGCGAVGKTAYHKLCQIYDVLAYIDNNEALWGETINQVTICSPKEAKDIYDRHETMEIVIAVTDYYPIYLQLKQIKMEDIVIWKCSLLYRCEGMHNLVPIVYKKNVSTKKENSEMSVLFVQTAPCIRTNKIAKALKDCGICTSLAYTENSPQFNNRNYAEAYQQYYPIFAMEELINLVNESDFDIVHSSNEPDILTALLTYCKKPIVHDCHDLSSAYKSMTPNEMAVEYVANVKSRGVIYTTEGIRQEALRKFNIKEDKTFVLENLISEELIPQKRLSKLSLEDGQIHIVYEGGIVGSDKMSHRYFEDIWLKIAQAGIHIHFYSHSDYQYCKKLEALHPNLHFEGNISSNELSVEMSKYDVGLCWLNTNEKNKQYLEFASPNKIQEYINAGLPVAVGNVKSQIEYVEKYRVGKFLDLAQDIVEQIKEIALINISDNILRERKLTLESRMDSLIDFYADVIQRQNNGV